MKDYRIMMIIGVGLLAHELKPPYSNQEILTSHSHGIPPSQVRQFVPLFPLLLVFCVACYL